MISARLATTLREIAAAAPAGRDDWWIIGSAAMVLAGVDGVEPEDVDILCGRETGLALAAAWNFVPNPKTDDAHFRSNPYGRAMLPGCHPIELMGDLEVKANGVWQIVTLGSRVPIAVEGGTVWIASLPDQIALFRLFGRDKDLSKARMCELLQYETKD